MPEERRRLAQELVARLARAILRRELYADGPKGHPDLTAVDDAATADIMMCSAP
jgi:hypothetical protein